MPNLPTQYDTDERDLNRVRIGTYIFAAFLAVMAGLSVLATFTYGGGFFMLPMSLLGAVFTALFAYANYRSAKAIEQRVDPHLTYFIAGMNMVYFPLGTILSWYTWRVMTRPTVQELYAQGTPALPPVEKMKAKGVASKAKAGPKIVAAPEPDLSWQDAMAHVDEAEEKLWADLEAKHKQQGTNKDEEKEDSSGGPIKLVPGED